MKFKIATRNGIVVYACIRDAESENSDEIRMILESVRSEYEKSGCDDAEIFVKNFNEQHRHESERPRMSFRIAIQDGTTVYACIGNLRSKGRDEIRTILDFVLSEYENSGCDDVESFVEIFNEQYYHGSEHPEVKLVTRTEPKVKLITRTEPNTVVRIRGHDVGAHIKGWENMNEDEREEKIKYIHLQYQKICPGRIVAIFIARFNELCFHRGGDTYLFENKAASREDARLYGWNSILGPAVYSLAYGGSNTIRT